MSNELVGLVNITTGVGIPDANAIFEKGLGNAPVNGYLLSSDITGGRSWVPPVSAAEVDLSNYTTLATTENISSYLVSYSQATSANALAQANAFTTVTSANALAQANTITYAASANALAQANAFTTVTSGNLQSQISNEQSIHEVSKEPTGFENRTDSTISYNTSTREFTISGAFNIWAKGIKYQKTSDSAIIPNTYGTHFIKYDQNGVFNVSQTPWDILNDIPIAYVFVASSGTDSFIAEERHGITMDGRTHKYLHFTQGAKYISGFSVGDYALTSDLSASNRYSISNGLMYDEDIENTVTGVADNGPYTVMSRTGSAGEWIWSKTENYPYLINANSIRYNQLNGNNWQLTNITTNNTWVNYYIFATNSLTSGFGTVIIPGQATYSSLALAQGESVSSLALGSLPFQEIVPIARISHRFNTTYANVNGRARIEGVSTLLGNSITVTQSALNNHNSLSGLQGGQASEYYHLTAAEIGDYIGASTVAIISAGLQPLNNILSSVSIGGPTARSAIGMGLTDTLSAANIKLEATAPQISFYNNLSKNWKFKAISDYLAFSSIDVSGGGEQYYCVFDTLTNSVIIYKPLTALSHIKSDTYVQAPTISIDGSAYFAMVDFDTVSCVISGNQSFRLSDTGGVTAVTRTVPTGTGFLGAFAVAAKDPLGNEFNAGRVHVSTNSTWTSGNHGGDLSLVVQKTNSPDFAEFTGLRVYGDDGRVNIFQNLDANANVNISGDCTINGAMYLNGTQILTSNGTPQISLLETDGVTNSRRVDLQNSSSTFQITLATDAGSNQEAFYVVDYDISGANEHRFYGRNEDEIMRFHASTGVSIGSTLDPGANNLHVGGTVNTSQAYYVDNVKVVGNRGAAITNPTTASASLQTKLIEVLDAMRAHGLIDT